MLGEEMVALIKRGVPYRELINRPGEKNMSYNTYIKYRDMDIYATIEYIKKRERKSEFDQCFLYIDEILRESPQISSVELLDMIKEKFPNIKSGLRALQIYLKPLKAELKHAKQRIYQFVNTSAEDNQVQVDNGEYVIKIGNSYVKIYFTVFVFSYSRRMFVYFQDRPFKTEDFIIAHEESIKYFGGSAKEYVYDQTKLVALKEKHGEVVFNSKFEQFAKKCNFKIRVCHAYDPESKGKVERMVKYIKSSFLYHRTFKDINDIQLKYVEWAAKKDTRIHGTTNERPADRFLEEKKYLNTDYFFFDEKNLRTADKTGYINYNSNQYSVPSTHQRKKVIICEQEGKLCIYDNKSYQLIATQPLASGFNQRITDPKHYPDKEEKIKIKTELAAEVMSHITNSKDIIEKIKSDNPKIQLLQLQGLMQLVKRYSAECWENSMCCINELPEIKVSILEKILKENQSKLVTTGMPVVTNNCFFVCSAEQTKVSSSYLDRPLDTYMKGVKNVNKNNNMPQNN